MKLLFISLGCDKNLVDSEVMLGERSRRGYSFTEDETEAGEPGVCVHVLKGAQ